MEGIGSSVPMPSGLCHNLQASSVEGSQGFQHGLCVAYRVALKTLARLDGWIPLLDETKRFSCASKPDFSYWIPLAKGSETWKHVSLSLSLFFFILKDMKARLQTD